MKRVSWKYLAGIVDGEGCIDVQVVKHGDPRYLDRHYARPRLRIAMADSSAFLLEMFQQNYGGHLCHRSKSSENPNWQSATSWELVGYSKACPVLRNIVNHLVLKREQARFCLWLEQHLSGRQVGQRAKDVLREELKLMKRDPHRLSETAQTAVWDAIVETAEQQ